MTDLAGHPHPSRRSAPPWVTIPSVVAVMATLLPLGLIVLGLASGSDDGADVFMGRSAVVRLPDGATGVKVDHSLRDDGLHAGDVVLAIDHIPVGQWPAIDRHPLAAGDPATYTVERGGQRLEVVVRLATPSIWTRLEQTWEVYAVPVVLLLVGTYVFLRRPRVRAAQLMVACGSLLLAGTVSSPEGPRLIDLFGARSLTIFAVGEIANCLMWSALLHFALTFPEPSRLIKHRPLMVGLVYALPFVTYGAALLPQWNSADTPVARDLLLMSISHTAALYMPLLAVVAILDAYRRSPDAVSRTSMRWVIVTLAGSAALYVAFGQIPERLSGRPVIPYEWLQFAFISSPLAVGAAVLRHQLFDVDVIVRRSLVNIGVLTPLVIVFTAPLFVVSRWLEVHPVLMTGVAAVLGALVFRPASDRLRRLALRRLYGARSEPHEVVSRLAHLEGESTGDVMDQLCRRMLSMLRLTYIAVELPSEGGFAVAASAGTPTTPVQQVPLLHQDRQVGRLALAVRAGREPFGRSDARLLVDLGNHIARVVEVMGLNEELRRSRSQIISAREEERRRLQRELHDGIGPALAAHAMQLDVARYLVATDPREAQEVLARLLASTQEIIGEVRRVVDGLRPMPLDQFGLVSAIQHQAADFSIGRQAGAPAVTFTTSGDLDHLPAAVEVAVYRTAMEALNNAVRHSGAANCSLSLVAEDGRVLVTVADDGFGVPENYQPGVGLASMRDRALELGGHFRIDSAPGRGSKVIAEFPIHGTPSGV